MLISTKKKTLLKKALSDFSMLIQNKNKYVQVKKLFFFSVKTTKLLLIKKEKATAKH